MPIWVHIEDTLALWPDVLIRKRHVQWYEVNNEWSKAVSCWQTSVTR